MSHPVTIIGAIIALGGWAFLLFGVGTDTGYGSVVNIHATAIAQSVIAFGYMLVLAGLVVEIGNRIAPRIGKTSHAPTANASVAVASTEDLAERAKVLRASLDANRSA